VRDHSEARWNRYLEVTECDSNCRRRPWRRVRYVGQIDSADAATRKLVSKLAVKYRSLTFCYEAGPTGYGLYRLIRSLGHDCVVTSVGKLIPAPRNSSYRPIGGLPKRSTHVECSFRLSPRASASDHCKPAAVPSRSQRNASTFATAAGVCEVCNRRNATQVCITRLTSEAHGIPEPEAVDEVLQCLLGKWPPKR
jgi:hypothetical protein